MFIVITGQDGSGKTSLVENISKLFSSDSVSTLHLPMSDFAIPALNISGEGQPMKDVHTDRLIFALDNRLAHYKIVKDVQQYEIVIVQRGWMDSFIHGAVQGYSYTETAALTMASDLIKPDISIYLNCEPSVAYSRIKNDPDKDKFETHDYMIRQYEETKKFYEFIERDTELKNIFSEPNFYIDTTSISIDETYRKIIEILSSSSLFLEYKTPIEALKV